MSGWTTPCLDRSGDGASEPSYLSAGFPMNWATFKRARAYVSPERWRVLAAGACAFVSGTAYVALVVLLGLLGEVLFTPWHTLRPEPENLQRLSEVGGKAVGRDWYGPAVATVCHRFPWFQ